jgi:hypothetical protein
MILTFLVFFNSQMSKFKKNFKFRYRINQTVSIAIFDKKLYITENTKEMDLIQSLLYADWKFHKFILYKLGFYDLETDTIAIYNIFKVPFYIFKLPVYEILFQLIYRFILIFLFKDSLFWTVSTGLMYQIWLLLGYIYQNSPKIASIELFPEYKIDSKKDLKQNTRKKKSQKGE